MIQEVITIKAIFEALPWMAFWAVVSLFVWVSHKQYMAGHDSGLFEHKTPQELRLQEAVIRKAELEAGINQPNQPKGN